MARPMNSAFSTGIGKNIALLPCWEKYSILAARAGEKLTSVRFYHSLFCDFDVIKAINCVLERLKENIFLTGWFLNYANSLRIVTDKSKQYEREKCGHLNLLYHCSSNMSELSKSPLIFPFFTTVIFLFPFISIGCDVCR